jgi:hypothetical protein
VLKQQPVAQQAQLQQPVAQQAQLQQAQQQRQFLPAYQVLNQ